MPDFPIDPELRIRATPSIVLRRTTEAVDFIRKVALSSSNRAWRDLLQSFEAARDEWSAMEAVVHLELLLEAEGLLIGEETVTLLALPKVGLALPRSRFARQPRGAVRPGVRAKRGFAVAACKARAVFPDRIIACGSRR